jgi:hypothetical protein
LSFAMAADEMGDARPMAVMKTIAIKRIILNGSTLYLYLWRAYVRLDRDEGRAEDGWSRRC